MGLARAIRVFAVIASIGPVVGAWMSSVEFMAQASPRVNVVSVSVSPQSVVGGQAATGTVALSNKAPSGGLVITIMSTNPSLAWLNSSTLTIAPGQSEGTFTINTKAVNSPQSVSISATLHTTAMANLTVNPAVSVSISGISLSPASVTGGATAVGTITLNGPAPAGGAAVSVVSSDASVAVPSTAAFAAGSTTQSFIASVVPVTATKGVTVTATLGASSASTPLTVMPPAVTALSFSPAVLGFDQMATGNVTLNGNAPAGGFIVNLSTNDPGAISLPATLLVPAGAKGQTFSVAAGAVTSTTLASVTASTGSATASATITISPALMAVPASLVLGSGTLVGIPSTQTVTLTNTGAVSVTLTSIAASAEFTQTNTCPSAFATGASCVITLTPLMGGSLTGNLTIDSNASNSSLTVNLSGFAAHWVSLDWTASSTPGVAYNVYRQVQSGGTCAAPSDTTYTRLNGSPINGTSYNDRDPALVPGDTYCYSLTAVDSGGASAFTNPPAVATVATPE